MTDRYREMMPTPESLVSFAEAEAANALNLPSGTVDITTDPELAWVGLVRVTEALINGGSATRAAKEAGCFDAWLQEQLHREDVTGRVARWVTQEILLGRWQSEPVLLRRFGHTCNTLEYHERRLRGRGLPRESIETFFGVYDEYLAEALSDYDEKVRKNIKKG